MKKRNPHYPVDEVSGEPAYKEYRGVPVGNMTLISLRRSSNTGSAGMTLSDEDFREVRRKKRRRSRSR